MTQLKITFPYECPVPLPDIDYRNTTERERSTIYDKWAEKYLVAVINEHGPLTITEAFWLIGPEQNSELRNAVRYASRIVCGVDVNPSAMTIDEEYLKRKRAEYGVVQ